MTNIAAFPHPVVLIYGIDHELVDDATGERIDHDTAIQSTIDPTTTVAPWRAAMAVARHGFAAKRSTAAISADIEVALGGFLGIDCVSYWLDLDPPVQHIFLCTARGGERRLTPSERAAWRAGRLPPITLESSADEIERAIMGTPSERAAISSYNRGISDASDTPVTDRVSDAGFLPPCPYPSGTQDAAAWWRGLRDAYRDE